MEFKKGINLATLIFLSVMIMFTIAILLGVVLRENKINSKNINENQVSNTENKNEIDDNYLEEIIDEDANKNINVKEARNEYSLEELINIIYAPDFYVNAIEEFDSIENASQEYLFAVATNSLIRSTNENEFYLNDFNDELVRIFGPKADNLLKKGNIFDQEFFYDANKDTYSIIGRGLSENDIRTFLITDIKNEGNKFDVTIYEYISKSVDKDGELSIDNASEVLICGIDGKTLLKFTVKEEKSFDGEYKHISYNLYDAKNNLVKNKRDYIKEHIDILKDKRKINLEYDEENNRYIVISNKLVK